MAKRYQQNQWNKLKEHFREHPYYKLCKTVFDEFQKLCSTMVMTPEQLFVDASLTLDRILHTGDISKELCSGLWTEKYNQYREQDLISGGDKDDTQAEVAMLFYMMMYGVATVNHSHYRGTLQRTLHDCIFKLYYGGDIKRCLGVEQNLREPVNQHTNEMMAWMAEYFVSTQSLTKEIGLILHPNRKAGTKEPRKKEEDKTPYVLKYLCSDETTRTNRLQRVMILMQNWGWIVEPKEADDFYDFFNGEHRACNLKWTGKPQTILTMLIQRLNEQPFFEKQTGASESAIVKNQFGLKSVNYNFERVSAKDKNRIALIIVVLNPDVALKVLPQKGRGDGFDYSDSVMNAVYKQELHVIKDLNKWYE